MKLSSLQYVSLIKSSLQAFNLFKFDVAYLNRLHVEKILSLEVKRDLTCRTCDNLFQYGDWVLSKKICNGTGKRTVKRHLFCALKMGIITEDDARQLNRLKNMIYVTLLTGWIMVMTQYSFVTSI